MLIRKTISLLILFTIMVMLPSLRYTVTPYFYTVQCACLVLFSVSIFILLPNPYKPIAILPLIIYRRNFSIVWNVLSNVVQKGYIETVKLRKDNTELYHIVKQAMNQTFNLETDFSLMDLKRPSIIVVNYCADRIENLVCMLTPVPISIMMRNTLGSVLDKVVKWTVQTQAKNSFDDTKKAVQDEIAQGRSVLSYATTHNTLSHEYIHKVRSGIFVIAKECNIPVTLVATDHFYSGLFGIIPYQNFRIKSSETFDVTNVKDAMHKARTFFRTTLTEFRDTKFT